MPFRRVTKPLLFWRWKWACRRRAKLWIIWLILGLLSGLFVQLISLLHLPWLKLLEPDYERAWIGDKLSAFEWMLGIPLIGWLANTAAGYPQVVFGFLFGAALSSPMLGWFHDRFWAAFNDDVLTKLGEATRPDRDEETRTSFIQLEWMPGSSGPRFHVWRGLADWTAEMGEPGRKNENRLSLGVLTGRSGSGKSRMAYELMRALARREKLGGRPSATLGWRCGVYWRNALPYMRRRFDDPWDAASLVAPRDGGFGHLIGGLKQWKPRCPTILLLDDPLPNEAGAIWDALSESDHGGRFRFPVCLLVTNQSIPPDTGLAFEASDNEWKRGGKAASPAPFVLPPEAWFNRQETVRAAFQTRALGKLTAGEQKAVRENLYRITQGNPLLVELAVEWLSENEHRDVQKLTAADLRVGRAKRIVAALRHHQVEDETQLAGLVLATLVGGASKASIDRERKVLFEIPVPLPRFEVLRACFPSDPLQPGDAARLPPIRPDIVGDAFIDQVLPVIGDAVALAEAGFRLNAAYMLRNLRRARPEHSAMTAAISLINPASISNADTVALALGFADVAAISQPDDRPLSTLESRMAAFDAARRMVGRLDEAQRRKFCVGLVTLCAVPQSQYEQRQIRPDLAMQLMNEAASNADIVAAETWISWFSLFAGSAVGSPGEFTGAQRTARLIQEVEVANRFADAAWGMGWPWRGALACVFSALAESAIAAGAEVRAARFDVMAAVSAPETARVAAERSRFAAKRHVDDALIQLEVASVRRYEATAWCLVPDGAESAKARAAADLVWEIAERFPENEEIHLQAALARRWEAIGWCRVPAGAKATEARAAADNVCAIAARFLDNEEIQFEAARARRAEGYAWCQVPAGVNALEARAAADVAWSIAARFPDNQQIQCEAAQARRMEGYAWSEVRAGVKSAEARVAADNACAIAERFSDNQEIQFEAARARRMEGFAWSQVLAGANVSEVRMAADFVWRIASRFPDNEQMQLDAAKVRRNEAYAWSEVPKGAKSMETRMASDVVRDIAARFRDNAEINGQAAAARRMEAYAWSQVPAGEKAAEARVAADIVRDIAARFPDDEQIQLEAANTRRNETYAWSKVPSGAKSTEARVAADIVRDIAARFPDNEQIQLEAARARRNEAYAWSEVPAGAKSGDARTAADIVRDIATRFPHNAKIQGEAAAARRMEAYAWSQVPAGEKASEARVAADKVWHIATIFIKNSGISNEATLAQGYANDAERRKSLRRIDD